MAPNDRPGAGAGVTTLLPRPATAAPEPGLEAAPAAAGRAEQAFTVVALVVLMRSPVLFLRQQAAGLVSAPIAAIWQDDALIRSAFIAVEVGALVLAVRTCALRAWRRQWALAALLLWVLVSVLWSVEPATTQLRSMMFVGTAAVGWYLGARYTLRQQAGLVAVAAGASAYLSALAIVVYPDEAKATNGVAGLWSGIFVNRNLLGAVVALGIVTTLALLPEASNRVRAVGIVTIALELVLFWRSGNRTGIVAVAAAGGLVAFVAVLRLARSRLTTAAGAAVTAVATAIGCLAVHTQWDRVTEALGRDSTLTRRVTMWAIDRHFIEQRPNRGWGFEAIWTHQPAIDEAAARFYQYPYQAHNGFYELLLGIGRIGFALFLVFIAVVVWRAFAVAWHGRDAVTLWPLFVLGYVLVNNFSEGFIVSNELQWALVVAMGFLVTSAARRAGDDLAVAP